jgi:lipopolysaccharide export system permease protein
VFFRYQPDHEIERIVGNLELVIDDLTNTRDKVILTELNKYPVVSEKAHTRPFERKWMNIVAAIILPVGIFLYIRMWMFRLRLLHDLHVIKQTNEAICHRIEKIT